MTNDCYLGVLGGGTTSGPPIMKGDIWTITTSKFIIDDLPLEHFSIYYRHPTIPYTQKQAITEISGFFVAFDITEFKEEDNDD
jgi:hypothetical protein